MMKKRQITFSLPSTDGRAIWECLGMIVLLLPSLVWISRDRTVWPWDQAWYGQVSTDLWYWHWRSPLTWVSTMMDGLDLKPPGIVWFGQFFVGLREVLGSVEASLLLSILLTQLALLWIIFKTGEAMFPDSRLPRSAGLVFAAAGQLFAGLSHQYLVEPLQALAAAWSLYAAFRSQDWPKARILIHLVAVMVLGALSKATTPVYCLFPVGYAALQLFRRRDRFAFAEEWKRRRSRALLVAVGLVGILCGLWYARHLSDVWKHVRDSTTGEVALEYGSRAPFLQKVGLWIGLLKDSFLAPYLSWVLLASLLLGPVLALIRRIPMDKQLLKALPIGVVSVLQILCLLLAFSSTISVDSRYMYALLPYLTILFVQCCALTPRLGAVALILACLVQWATVQAAAFSPAYIERGRSEWLRVFQPDSTRYDDVTRVVRATSGAPEHNSIVAVEEPWFNANTLQFFTVKERLATGIRGYYVSLGYAQKNSAAAFNRIAEYNARQVVTLDERFQNASPNFLNVTSLPVLKRLREDPRFTATPFNNASGIVVFQVSPEAAGLAANTPVPDNTTVPPEIARRHVVQRGKSALDSFNGSVGDNTGTFVSPAEGALSCSGWAFDDQEKSTPEDVWIELTDVASGRHHYWHVRRYSRPALAAAVKVPSVVNSGFQCEPVRYRIPAGTYRARVYQLAGDQALVSDFTTYTNPPQIAVR
jgi:hypothetical protein